jgi:molecular chaperone DnaJ
VSIVHGRSHYLILGVSDEASSEEIRAAYRELARHHHPDHSASRLRSDEDTDMSALNEAYRVLSDRGRRAIYDASLRTGSAVGPSFPPAGGSSSVNPEDARNYADLPIRARISWRWVLTFCVAVVAGGVVLSLLTGGADEPAPDGILRVGDCVEIEVDLDAREVACTGDVGIDQVVLVVVDFDERCPASAEPHRDQQGMGIACVEVPS